MSKRRGRPRNAPRPRFDLGTTELQIIRAAISPKDATLATCPLDALKSRGLINAETYSAAEHFRACHRTKFGSPHPRAVDPSRTSGGTYMGNTEHAEAGYRSACDALRRLSRQHMDVIENLVVHERWPVWMFEKHANTKDRERAMEAFAVLLGWDRRTARRAAE